MYRTETSVKNRQEGLANIKVKQCLREGGGIQSACNTVSSHLVVITQTEWWMGRMSLQDPSGSSLGFQGPSSIMKVVAI